MNSIKVKLSLIANLVAAFALIILSIVSFYFTKSSLYENTLHAETALLRVTQTSVENFRLKNIGFLNALEKDILKLPYEKINSQDKIIENVGPILKHYRHGTNMFALYIGLSNGENIVNDKSSDQKNTDIVINGKANNYDATTRGWYKEARRTNQIYTSPVYVDSVSKEFVITYSKALYKDGKFIGVLGIDTLLEELQDEIANNPGNALIFGVQNQVFAATNKNLLNPSIDHSPILKAYQANGEQDYQFFSYQFENDDRLGACTKIFSYTACITKSTGAIDEPIFKTAYVQGITAVIIMVFNIILLYSITLSLPTFNYTNRIEFIF